MLSFSLSPSRQALVLLLALSALAMGLPNTSAAEWWHLLMLAVVATAVVAFAGMLAKKGAIWEEALHHFLVMFLLLAPVQAMPTLDIDLAALSLGALFAVFLLIFGEVNGRFVLHPGVAGTVAALVFSRLIPGATALDGSAARLVFDELFAVGGISISLTALVLAIWIFWGMSQWGRRATFIAFLSALVALTYVFDGGAVGATRVLSVSPFVYVFASLLLPYLKTSPQNIWQQVVLGTFAAALVLVPLVAPLPAGEISAFVLEYRYLIGLLLLNLAYFLWSAMHR